MSAPPGGLPIAAKPPFERLRSPETQNYDIRIMRRIVDKVLNLMKHASEMYSTFFSKTLKNF